MLKGDKALFEKLDKMVSDLNAGVLSVGFHSGDKYEDGTPVAAVAFWNEFGTGKIPARPFFRGMIAKESGHWGSDLAGLLKKDFSGEKALNAMGMVITGELQQSITDFDSPRNAPSTIAAKGFDKPLIDTGFMKESVTHKVE